MRERSERISWTEPNWHYRPYARQLMRDVLAPVRIIRIVLLVSLIVGPLAWYLTRKYPYLEMEWWQILLLSWVVTALYPGYAALGALFPRSVTVDGEGITLDWYGSRRTYGFLDLRGVVITRVAKGRYVLEFHSGKRAFKIGISHKVDVSHLITFLQRHTPETISVREVAEQSS